MWLYQNREFTEDDIADNVGFVYLIENKSNNKKYIGKKLFTKAKTKQVKGKKKKIRVSSDWLKYWGSNDILKDEVKTLGEQNYTRTILHLCKTKGICNYLETWEIFTRHALLSEEYYNFWVSCKIHKSHVLHKISIDYFQK